MENISSTEAQHAWTQLPNTMHMHLEDDLDKVKKNWDIYCTIWLNYHTAFIYFIAI
jgi:hypothetical protein